MAKLRTFFTLLLCIGLCLNLVPVAGAEEALTSSHEIKGENDENDTVIHYYDPLESHDTVTFLTQNRTQNFNKSYSLTGNGASDIVAVAAAQIGRTKSDLGYSEAWCANFLGDCADLAGLSDLIPRYGGVSGLRSRIIDNGADYWNYNVSSYISNIQAGDIVVFLGNDNSHISLVEYVTDSEIHCIDGNWSDAVQRVVRYKQNSLNDNWRQVITTVLRPHYDTVSFPRANVLSGVYVIHSALDDNMCLDIAGNSKESDANIQLYSQEYTDVQKFRIIRWDGSFYCVQSVYSGLWLDAKTPVQDNSNVKLYVNNNGNENDWYFEDAGGGYVYIKNRFGYYLDVQGDRAVNNANVQLYHFVGNNSQKWRLEDVTNYYSLPDGTYNIQSAINSNYALDISGNETGNRANIQLYQVDNSTVQQFSFTKESNYYTIKSVYADKWLDIRTPIGNNSNVQLWENCDSDEEQWILEDAGDGYVYIRSNADYYLDVQGDEANNNANIQVYHFVGTNSQKWKITPVTGGDNPPPAEGDQNNKITFHPQGGTLGEPIASRTIDGVNTDRLNGQLIVYNDPARRVECNGYGLEIGINSNGKVVSIREYGNETQLAIPDNGFVLSGHLAWPTDPNDGCNFLDDITIGQYVAIDYNLQQVYVFTSYSAYLANNKSVKANEQYGDLPKPEKDNYFFAGWYTEAEGGEEITASSIYSTDQLFAHWIPDSYTVTYDTNGGGKAPESQIKTYGNNLTLSTTEPLRGSSSIASYFVHLDANGGVVGKTDLTVFRTTSYTFKNWNTAANGSGTSYNPGATYSGNADLTLYAQWNSSTSTAAVTLPTPTRSGYAFKGWATSSSATSGFTGSYLPTDNVTLYAVWEANTYTVTYDANSGTGAPEAQAKTHGTNLILSSTKPTRPNSSVGSYTVTLNANGGSVSPTSLSAARTTSYTFKNWNTASNGSGTSYAPGATYSTDANLTLYAQWTSSTNTAAVTLPTPTRTGYSFKGWATNSAASSGVIGNYTPSGNVTLYAVWEANKYTVTYDANSGTGAPEAQAKTHGTNLILSSTKPTRPNTNAGSYAVTLNANGGSVNPASLNAARTTSYTFRNWNTAANGSGTSYNPGAAYSSDADVTLYAQWTSSTSTAAVMLPTPTRTGYSFKGWATNSTASSGVIGNYTPSGNVTLYAVWEANKYTITYDANGGTGAPANQTKTHGTNLTISGTKPTRPNTNAGSYAVTLNANGGSVNPASLDVARTTSYTFKNWNTAANGSGTSYNAGASYSTDADVTLYAQWNSSTKTATVNLPMPTRAGCNFKGWAMSSGAAEGVTGSYTPNGNVTLYAVWTEDTPTAHATLALDDVSAAPGGKIAVPLRLENNPGLIAVEVEVSYDSNVLEWIGVEPGEYGDTLGDYELTVGQPLAWFASDERTDVTLNGVYATLLFRVNENADDGETVITLSMDEENIFNAEMDNVAITVKSGTVTIKSHIPGDVNGDGKVNNKDYMALRRYIKYKDNVVVEAALDINGDGKVNNKDYMSLRRYIKYHDIEIQ